MCTILWALNDIIKSIRLIKVYHCCVVLKQLYWNTCLIPQHWVITTNMKLIVWLWWQDRRRHIQNAIQRWTVVWLVKVTSLSACIILWSQSTLCCVPPKQMSWLLGQFSSTSKHRQCQVILAMSSDPAAKLFFHLYRCRDRILASKTFKLCNFSIFSHSWQIRQLILMKFSSYLQLCGLHFRHFCATGNQAISTTSVVHLPPNVLGL